MMLFEDTYFTIASTSESVFRDRSSRFIGLAVPVSNEQEMKLELEKIKKKYFDATHHCYAFRLGFDKTVFRFSDDGEPSGTSGRPIFGQIQSKDLTNVLVVVVRYYGGTKLGVPGLINAYKTAAKEALENNTIVEKTVNDVYEVLFTYEQMNDVMRILKDENIKQLSQNFDLNCKIEFSVRKLFAGKIYEKLSLIKGVTVNFIRTE
ncbi:MAG TPA: YigZ family protein [Bacteroidales bacterium]|nr:YigZ family protein [Bacteroidales bacterium]